jgi:Golgi phosphoprotein 3 (GPP34)
VHRLIADDLVFLAVAAELSGWPLGRGGEPDVPPGLGLAVAGALLADLYLLGRISVGREEVLGWPGRPTGHADLDGACDRIMAERSRRPVGWWVRGLAATRPELRRISVLRRAGLITEYAKPAGPGVRARTSRYIFAPEYGYEGPLLDQLNAARRGAGADGRTLLLLAVVRAYGLHAQWFRDLPFADVERQLDAVLRGSWIGPPVAAAIASAGLPGT